MAARLAAAPRAAWPIILLERGSRASGHFPARLPGTLVAAVAVPLWRPHLTSLLCALARGWGKTPGRGWDGGREIYIFDISVDQRRPPGLFPPLPVVCWPPPPGSVLLVGEEGCHCGGAPSPTSGPCDHTHSHCESPCWGRSAGQSWGEARGLSLPEGPSHPSSSQPRD